MKNPKDFGNTDVIKSVTVCSTVKDFVGMKNITTSEIITLKIRHKPKRPFFECPM